MTNSNELTVNENGQAYDNETGELITGNEFQPTVVEETDKYIVFKMPDGKFVRKAKYAEYSSVVATTREEKMWLLNVMDSDEETGIGLKEMVGKEFMVSDIITRPYDSIDEDTGQKIFGVLTYLITPDKQVYVTSSKSIYFSVDRLMEFIGSPHEEDWVDIKVAIGQVKMPNGMGLTFKMVG